MTVEGEETKVEEVVQEVKPTEPKVEPTVPITETKEFRHELDKALGKGLESTNKQLSMQQAEAKAAKAEVAEHKASVEAVELELQDLRREQSELVEKQFSEDPEARKAYVDRRSIADEKRVLAKKTAEAERKLYDAEKLGWAANMSRKADVLVKETGIGAKELENCKTEEEMEVKALRFQLNKEPEVKEPAKDPKFDKSVSTDSSPMPEKAQAKMRAGWEEYHKNK